MAQLTSKRIKKGQKQRQINPDDTAVKHEVFPDYGAPGTLDGRPSGLQWQRRPRGDVLLWSLARPRMGRSTRSLPNTSERAEGKTEITATEIRKA